MSAGEQHRAVKMQEEEAAVQIFIHTGQSIADAIAQIREEGSSNSPCVLGLGP